MLQAITLKASTQCAHCGESITKDGIYAKNNDAQFCCSGCQSLFQSINAYGLSHFYQLNKNLGQRPLSAKNDRPEELDSDFSIFDKEDFRRDFAHISEDRVSLNFYIEGVTCFACVWLIEKLPEIHPEIVNMNFNNQNFCLSLTIKNSDFFSPILNSLEKIGHKAHFLESSENIQEWQIEEERQLLKKLAVAGASFGNVMLLSVSQYAGADQEWKKIFDVLSLLIATPSVIYSGQYFFKSSYHAIKNRTINLDVPLAVAILVGFIGSTINILKGSGAQYLDSVTGLIFLILITRYILRVSSRHAFKSNDIKKIFETGPVMVFNQIKNQFESVYYKYLKTNQRVQINPGQVIPCDGQLSSEYAYLNLSFLNGGPSVYKFIKDDEILAGAINCGAVFELISHKVGKETQLGKILNEVTKTEDLSSKKILFADRQAKYFLSTVLSLGAAVLIFFIAQGKYETAFSRFLALFIVSCPCALSLATPMALTRALKQLMAKGILVKSDSALENLLEIQHIFLDKTGTLTQGQCQVKKTLEIHPSTGKYSWPEIIFALEAISQHPLAKALKIYFSKDLICNSNLSLKNHEEIAGVGVQALLDNDLYFLGQYKESKSDKKELALYRNGQAVILMEIDDPIRENTISLINELKKSLPALKEIYIVSGDKQNQVEKTAKLIGVKNENAYGEIGPEEKAKLVEKSKLSLMIGDGVNDALAMKLSKVGIAVSGSMQASLFACDIYFKEAGLEQLLYLFFVAKKVSKIIKRNMLISISYNLVAAILAIGGFISPLAAALIMPIASLTALFSTIVEPLEFRGKV